MIFLLLAYWYLYPFHVFNVKSFHVTDKKVYKGGDTLRYHVVGQKYMKCEKASVIREIIDGIVIPTIEEETNGQDIGTFDFWSRGIELPEYLDGLPEL